MYSVNPAPIHLGDEILRESPKLTHGIGLLHFYVLAHLILRVPMLKVWEPFGIIAGPTLLFGLRASERAVADHANETSYR